MSKTFSLRVPNAEDFAGSPLLDDDDDEVTTVGESARQPKRSAPAARDKVVVLPQAVTDRPRPEASQPPAAAHTPTHRAPSSAPNELDAGNPFVPREDLLHENDESGDEREAPARSGGGSRNRKRPRDSRFVLTEQHESILDWTEKARYTSKEQVAVYLEVAPRKAVRLLNRLVDQGFMDKKVRPGSPSAYFLTELGKEVVGSDVRVADRQTGMGLVPHTLAVGWLMLSLLKRASTLTPNVERALGRHVELSDFVSESELKRALNTHVGRLKSAAEEASFRTSGYRKQALKWEGWTTLHGEAVDRARSSSKIFADQLINLAVWDVGSDQEFGMPHCPDLILWTGKRALAFEVELSRKPASAADIVRAYGSPTASPFTRVIWLCGRDSVQQLVDDTVKAYSESPAVRRYTSLTEDELESRRLALLRERSHAAAEQRDERVLADIERRQDELAQTIAMLRASPENAKARDDKATAALLMFHDVGFTDSLSEFRAERLAALDKAEAASQEANRAARAREPWHVNLAGKAVRCRCGVTCMAAHGQFPSEQAARDFAEELV